MKYIEENMHVNPYRLFWHSFRTVDFKQPIAIVGRDKKDSSLFVSGTDSGPLTNSLLTKAIRFIKL